MRFLKPKLSPVGMAAALVKPPEPKPLQVVEFSDIERAVAERIPLKDAMRSLASQLQAELDAALQKAVEAYLGYSITDPETLRGRLAHVQMQGRTDVTYCVDGTPVLWVGEAVFTRDGDTMKVDGQLRQLVPDVAETKRNG